MCTIIMLLVWPFLYCEMVKNTFEAFQNRSSRLKQRGRPLSLYTCLHLYLFVLNFLFSSSTRKGFTTIRLYTLLHIYLFVHWGITFYFPAQLAIGLLGWLYTRQPSGQAVVTDAFPSLPPVHAFVFTAHRVQHSHFSASMLVNLRRFSLTHDLPLHLPMFCFT